MEGKTHEWDEWCMQSVHQSDQAVRKQLFVISGLFILIRVSLPSNALNGFYI